jgi:hypothetical protein
MSFVFLTNSTSSREEIAGESSLFNSEDVC